MRPRLLLLALLFLPAIASGLRADPPSASLTGSDMLAELRQRRAALAEAVGQGTILLLPAPSREMAEFRPDPNLFYLTGVTSPAVALVLRVERPRATARAREARLLADRLADLSSSLFRASTTARRLFRTPDAARELSREAQAGALAARRAASDVSPLVVAGRGPLELTEILYLRKGSAGRARWSGPSLAAGPDAAAATGIAEVRELGKLFPELRRDLPASGRLFHDRRARHGRSDDRALERLLEARDDLFVRDAGAHLAALRGRKSEEEVARIRRACRVTCDGLREAMRSCRPGMTELDLQAVLEYACRRGGARRQAFPSIVGSGPNGTILHYQQNRRTIEKGDLVLMDVGGEFMGYAADVTRTFPAGGRFTKEQAEIYDVVLEAQAKALAEVRPGGTLQKVHRAAYQVIAKAGHSRAFPHGTSHHVGLDVHDPTPGGKLEPGMVFTVEPGIYLVDRGLGIRIEDTVLVTEDGHEILSPGAPKTRAEIEALMKEKGIGNQRIR